jgi:hypothetical protein
MLFQKSIKNDTYVKFDQPDLTFAKLDDFYEFYLVELKPLGIKYDFIGAYVVLNIFNKNNDFSGLKKYLDADEIYEFTSELTGDLTQFIDTFDAFDQLFDMIFDVLNEKPNKQQLVYNFVMFFGNKKNIYDKYSQQIISLIMNAPADYPKLNKDLLIVLLLKNDDYNLCDQYLNIIDKNSLNLSNLFNILCLLDNEKVMIWFNNNFGFLFRNIIDSNNYSNEYFLELLRNVVDKNYEILNMVKNIANQWRIYSEDFSLIFTEEIILKLFLNLKLMSSAEFLIQLHLEMIAKIGRGIINSGILINHLLRNNDPNHLNEVIDLFNKNGLDTEINENIVLNVIYDGYSECIKAYFQKEKHIIDYDKINKISELDFIDFLLSSLLIEDCDFTKLYFRSLEYFLIEQKEYEKTCEKMLMHKIHAKLSEQVMEEMDGNPEKDNMYSLVSEKISALISNKQLLQEFISQVLSEGQKFKPVNHKIYDAYIQGKIILDFNIIFNSVDQLVVNPETMSKYIEILHREKLNIVISDTTKTILNENRTKYRSLINLYEKFDLIYLIN